MRGIITRKFIISCLLLAVLAVSAPQQAQARNLFRQFFHDLKRGTRFIVTLPDKATKWMGPVLGPIASGILTQNIAGHNKLGNLFRNAHRVNNAINDIEEQQRLTGEVKQMYRDQAGELRNYVKQLEDAREKLRSQLTDRDISLSEYMETAIDLDNMIATVNQAADRFETNADKINTGSIIKMAANSLLENIVGEIKNAALNELNDEVLSMVNPDLINILIGQDSSGLDGLLDILISGNLEGYDGQFDTDALRDKVKDRIKEILKENKDALKDNMKGEIDKIIQDIMSSTNSEVDNIKNQGGEAMETNPEVKEPENPYSDEELAATLTEIPKDEFGCRPGYEWQRMSGVGCVQKNCAEAGGHYSYTKTCICSFVDPKPGDNTKACMRPANYLACPSCVFACVAPDADCPER